MERQHQHNLRSAPHSERRIRATNRRGSTTSEPHRSAPESGEQQNPVGSETLDPATVNDGGLTGDVSGATAGLQLIAAQQQQMQQMQTMMIAMQRQMASLQQTITNIAATSPPKPLIKAPTNGDPTAERAVDAHPSAARP